MISYSGLRCFATAIFFTLLMLFPVYGQDTAATPSPREQELAKILSELQKQKEIAELERDIAKARQESRETSPKPTSTPIKSDTVITGDEIEPNILVFDELKNVTGRIALKLRSKLRSGATLVVMDSATNNDLKFYQKTFPLFKIALEDLSASYCKITRKADVEIKSTPDRGFGLAAGLLQGANVAGQIADLLSYFRTETKISAKSINVEESSLVTALFGELSDGNDMTLLYPKNASPETPLFCSRTEAKPCCTEAGNCEETRNGYCSEAANLIDVLYRTRRAAIDSNPKASDFARIEKDFDDIYGIFVKKQPGSDRNTLEIYMNVEQIAALKKVPNTYFLNIRSLEAVGKQRLRKNLFLLSDKVDYAGGILIEWSLYDAAGKFVSGGIESSYGGYKKPSELKPKL